MSIHALAILQSLILVSTANTAPVALARLLGARFARPIDGGLVLRDGHPLLGRSKTWRGLAAAILLAACLQLAAQENPVQDRPSQDNPAQDASPPTPRYDFRYSLAVIDDATFYSKLTPPLPPPVLSLPITPLARTEPSITASAAVIRTKPPPAPPAP